MIKLNKNTNKLALILLFAAIILGFVPVLNKLLIIAAFICLALGIDLQHVKKLMKGVESND